MPKRYTPETKERIFAAVDEARKAGKNWVEVHAAAKAAGFRGKMPALRKVFYETRGGTRKPAAAGPAKAVKSAKVLIGGLAEIEVVVQREVEKRLKQAKDAAWKAFTSALGV